MAKEETKTETLAERQARIEKKKKAKK